MVVRLDSLVLAIHMQVSIDTDNKHRRQLNHIPTKPIQVFVDTGDKHCQRLSTGARLSEDTPEEGNVYHTGSLS